MGIAPTSITVLPPTSHALRFRPQPRAVADRTRLLAHKAAVPAARVVGLGLVEEAVDVEDDALHRAGCFRPPRVILALGVILEVDFLLARAVNQHIAERLRQILPRLVPDRRRSAGRWTSIWCIRQLFFFLRMLPYQRSAPSIHGEGRVVDDEVRIDFELRAQAIALRAHPQRRVEAEELRRQVREADAAVGAGVVLAEEQFLRLLTLSVAHRRYRRRPAPSPALSAVSTESISRVAEVRHTSSVTVRVSGTASRSTINSMLCCLVFASLMLLFNSDRHAVDARTQRSRPPRCASTSACVPLRCLTRWAPATGSASPMAAPSIWSAICCALCDSTLRPHSGQCGSPTRAKSTRR